MKSVILRSLVTLCILSATYRANAQIVNQGIWTVGGSVSFSSSKQEGAGTSTTVISLLPEGGYFIIDDLGVGLNALYSTTSQNNATLTEIGVGPWARYYIYQNAFAQAGFMAGSITIDGDFGKARSTNTTMQIGLGYSAWLADAVALEPLIFFNMKKSKDEGDTPVNTNTVGLSIGLKVFMGR